MTEAKLRPYNIITGVDFTHSSDHAVRETQSLAERLDLASLHFVHALDITRISRGEISVEQASVLVADAAARLENRVRTLLLDHASAAMELDVMFHVRLEDPETALLRVASHEDADLLIVGASTTSGVAQLWHRSAVRSLIKRARVPVLVVQPPFQADEGNEDLASESSGVFERLSLTARGHLQAGKRSSLPPPPAPIDDSDSASYLCGLHDIALNGDEIAEALRPPRTVRVR